MKENEYYYGQNFADKTYTETFDYAWGRMIIAIGSGNGRIELSALMQEYAAYQIQMKEQREAKAKG